MVDPAATRSALGLYVGILLINTSHCVAIDMITTNKRQLNTIKTSMPWRSTQTLFPITITHIKTLAHANVSRLWVYHKRNKHMGY